MGYFFFSGTSRGLPDGTTITLAPLEVEVTPMPPTITVGTVLKLPVLEVNTTIVMPTIDVGTELELSALSIEATVMMPSIGIGAEFKSWWYYDMVREGE